MLEGTGKRRNRDWKENPKQGVYQLTWVAVEETLTQQQEFDTGFI